MKRILFNDNWTFNKPNEQPVKVTIPHTWNGTDGQDGGGDYYRSACTYKKTFAKPQIEKDGSCYLVFKGVNSEAKVLLNGKEICSHEGGYSTFGVDITAYLKENNELTVIADNTPNDRVYPQFADFTFYGGIYRDVYLVTAPKNAFAYGPYWSHPIKATPKVEGKCGILTVETSTKCADSCKVKIEVYDGDKIVATSYENTIKIDNVHLWNGVSDPHLYKVVASIEYNGVICDSESVLIGFRTYSVDPKKGFYLNGKPYSLHGVSRHQDRKALGNAITKKEHDEDMALIQEIGANTIRLAHYQHDDYFYELCDKAGMIIWAEIPYISKHMPNANDNLRSQMSELILQQYNHPSICFWGVSNEITMKATDNKDMLKMHYELNDLCHKLDSTRKTTLACFAMCGPFNKSATITDVVSWNLYLGWYMPGLFLNDLWTWFYKLFHGKRCLGYSEYGAEGMPNLHAAKPKRFDNTEEYQAIYHEYMLEFFARNKHMWATHVWNMFDFAADGRNQGGEPGMNHKGLVTFDRKIKKDAFYVYKAYWSEENVLHLCGKRYINRHEAKTNITIYSNVGTPELYANGKKVSVKAKKGGKVYVAKVAVDAENVKVEVKANGLSDSMTIVKVATPDPKYSENAGNSMSWEK